MFENKTASKVVLHFKLVKDKKLRLKEYLRVNKISYKNFGEIVGVSDAQITRIIKRQQNPSAHLTHKILEATKNAVTFEDLFNPEAPSRLHLKRKRKSVGKNKI